MDDDMTRDMCPICKTDRYLSPNMVFLINPECYHKICESCVDRIFSLGPAQCPYPKCSKILRKNRFKKQVFDDILIEREIDIRKRIQRIYNKTEEDFASLPEYNAYLEAVEEITFKLCEGIDTDETEKEVSKYEAEHKIEILEIAMRESQKDSDVSKFQEATERLRQEKLNIQKQMEAEDAEFQKQQKVELMEKLQSSAANAEEIMKQQKNAQLKRLLLRKRQLQQISSQLDQKFLSNKAGSRHGAGLDSADAHTPFTPFCGDRDVDKKYTLLGKPTRDVVDITDTYYDPYVNKMAQNREFLGGGWRLKTLFERALDEAFMGLSCFIETERAPHLRRGPSDTALMEKLQSSAANAEEIMKQQKNAQLKRLLLRKRQLQQISSQLDQKFLSNKAGSRHGAGLDSADAHTPFTPFCGDRDVDKKYTLLGKPTRDVVDITDTYYDPYVNKMAQNREFLGGGWRLKTLFERALDEAFMGLSCFIETERAPHLRRGPSDTAVSQ
ncbi:CDK-activating kinase assembly factor [Metschnikowia bicuspidata var. bicuspidata NRRL YB-4993]|uniref:RNA polymerase II transcription factor B subunit 3 n=1 Tax=Metschnikowia bicuspidata var. bicuspidata NRRL YB-4993 TaxID=869754 RepID=A0A1A0H261_9ASCO|nr:CDK-activating kinase assembly factor [Metschnikowia bicuspidata var. bicuspidata NRRL YB-4993]OBA18040.1 CDK-activating kinase assembly factor [Metschnikowia bicuspidata var. bicuspidata NRRL YB-4993]